MPSLADEAEADGVEMVDFDDEGVQGSDQAGRAMDARVGSANRRVGARVRAAIFDARV